MEKYIYSDMVLDCGQIPTSPKDYPSELSEEHFGSVRVCRLDIDTEELSKKYRRTTGRYVTLFCEKLWLLDNEELLSLSRIISSELKKMISLVTSKKISRDFRALIIGLGNPDVTPDAIGPLTLSNITVTRHLASEDSSLFENTGMCEVSAILPGVSAQRGIDAQELVLPVIKAISPDVVIATDALATRSCERLASTVQISSDGISPGAGIGNHRKEICAKVLGVPVIALGIPTVVDSATLVCDALQSAGFEEIPHSLQKTLDHGRAFFVSPKECDVIAHKAGRLLGKAIDLTFALK